MGRRTPGRETSQENIPIFNCIFTKNNILGLQTSFFMVLTCSWVSWLKNDAERSRNFFKKQILNPKHVRFNQNSDFCMQFPYSFLGPNPDRAPTQSGLLKGTYWSKFLSILLDFSGPYGPIRAYMGPARALEEREKLRKHALFLHYDKKIITIHQSG